MKTNVTLSRICAASLLLALAAPASAQDNAERVRGTSPDMGDVARTPITDLNLRKDPIPEVLLEAVMAPYASERLPECGDLAREILRLDHVLGPDIDLEDDKDGLTVGKVAKSAVGSFIPFRGIIREVTGAADHQREFQNAIFAGAVRRGYLKGLGEQRGCSYPARPAFASLDITDEDRVDWEEPEDETN
ncbi:MAG: hypothetical protein ABJM58_03085 [Alteripontixanthobacter sp.]